MGVNENHHLSNIQRHYIINKWAFEYVFVIPDREISLLPLKLGQGASFFQDSQQNCPAPAGPVQAQTSGPETIVDSSNQGQYRPHFSAKSSQLGIWQRSAMCQQFPWFVSDDISVSCILILLKVSGSETCRKMKQTKTICFIRIIDLINFIYCLQCWFSNILHTL